MIVNRTADLARRRGITKITDLAERAGLSYNTAHALFTGRTTRIDYETLERLCATLEVEPGDVLIRVKPTSNAATDGLGHAGEPAAALADDIK